MTDSDIHMNSIAQQIRSKSLMLVVYILVRFTSVGLHVLYTISQGGFAIDSAQGKRRSILLTSVAPCFVPPKQLRPSTTLSEASWTLSESSCGELSENTFDKERDTIYQVTTFWLEEELSSRQTII